MESSNTINLAQIYQEIAAALRQTELRAAEMRGQVQLIERLIQESQSPVMTGDDLGEQGA